jgi:hypothetical protein
MEFNTLVWLAERSGVFLLVAATALGAGELLSRSRAGWMVTTVLLVLVLVPFGDVTGITFLYSVVGPLSVASILFCVFFLGWMSSLIPNLAWHDIAFTATVIALLGLLLYPGAIGLLPWDPYRLGFHGAALPIMLIIIAGVAVPMNSVIAPIWITLSAASWQVGLFRSTNLWDYVIDPVVWLAATLFLAGAALRALATIHNKLE